MEMLYWIVVERIIPCVDAVKNINTQVCYFVPELVAVSQLAHSLPFWYIAL